MVIFSAAPDLGSGQDLATFSGRAWLARWWPAVLVLIVVLTDQTAKWVAGHDPTGLAYVINGGVDRDAPRFLDAVVRSVPAGGALDLAAVVVVAGLAAVAVRARGMVRAGLLMYVGGWASNLLDRLGASYLTVPAAHARGVVDLAWLGSRNVADYSIRAGVATLALTAVLHAVGGLPGVSRGLDAARRAARRAWRPALAVVAAAAAGLWVGAAGQAGAVRAARADAQTLRAFVSASGVVLPGCRHRGRGSLTDARPVTFSCPVRGTDGRARTLTITRTPAAAPTVTVARSRP